MGDNKRKKELYFTALFFVKQLESKSLILILYSNVNASVVP